MAEVLGKVCGPPTPWSVTTDPSGKLTIAPVCDLVVRYSTGSSDTVPAHVAAAEGPLDPAFTWCPYTVPGSGTLHVVKESDIATLSGDYCLLGHVHQHEVAPHQPAPAAAEGGGGGTTVACKAYSTTEHTLADGAFLYIPLEHTTYDQGTASPQHDDDTNPEQLLCQQAGIYMITGFVLVANPDTGAGDPIGPGPITLRLLRYDALGTEELLSGQTVFEQDVPGSSFPLWLNPSAQCHLDVGDYVTMGLRNSSGVSLRVQANSDFDFGFVDTYPSLAWRGV